MSGDGLNKDAATAGAIRASLETGLNLPPAAVEWLMGMWRAAQFFDDLADGEPVERAAVDAAIFDLLVDLPRNPFFVAHREALSLAVATQALKWQASDAAEIGGRADERSFVWRAGFWDLVLAACALCHGAAQVAQHAEKILGLYGETFSEYRKEFPGHA